jgi:hypothetical protein
MGKKPKLAGLNNLTNKNQTVSAARTQSTAPMPTANVWCESVASRIQKLHCPCRPFAFREVTEAGSLFCEIPVEELNKHFSRVFCSGVLLQEGMPMDVPWYEAPASNNQNPYEAEFMTLDVWKCLSRCSNMLSASEWNPLLGLEEVWWGCLCYVDNL